MTYDLEERVIISASKYKKADLAGLVGIVKRYWTKAHKYGILIPDKDNGYSATGLWWLEESELKPYSEENSENTEEEIFMLPGYKIAFVHFPDDEREDRSYPYALYDDGTFSESDDVVVKTGHHGFALAKIVGIQEYQPDLIRNNREVVCRLDFTPYLSRQTKIAEIQDLEAKMKAKAKQLQDVALYQLLAEKSPEMKEMLDRYTELMK